ncbi:MAG: SAM-dependent methyltransferase [Chloroflexi bacterium RBG_16_47_49]|nr:MAG: SAM-dependent methyltransferase [Chloroflexi bacterium RBG_16_47_49]
METLVSKSPSIELLSSTHWEDYELLDSGYGLKLERFGAYRFVRPEHQAIWRPTLSQTEWKDVDAVFQATSEESGGNWIFSRSIEPQWKMHYRGLSFMARTSNSRHLGLFPEQATHWDWIREQVTGCNRPIHVLNLFGYTGLASLAAAAVGAQVTHVDASKKTIQFAKENQQLSGLGKKPIRWIIDDAVKYIKREARRGMHYDGVILDPPKFGRGPKGEVWEFFKMLPFLLQEIKPVLAPKPVFLVITAYAIRASALSLHYTIQEMMSDFHGELSSGELTITEKSAGRILSMAIFSRWSSS